MEITIVEILSLITVLEGLYLAVKGVVPIAGKKDSKGAQKYIFGVKARLAALGVILIGISLLLLPPIGPVLFEFDLS